MGCLYTQFAIQTELVGVHQIFMIFVRRCRIESEFRFQHIFKLHLLTVIIVGKQLQIGQQRIVTFPSFIPVVGNIVLGNLQRTVTTCYPPVWLADLQFGFSYPHIHRLFIKQTQHFCFRFRLHIFPEHFPASDLLFRSTYKLGCIQVNPHQCAVYNFI
ncbi:unknown [Bacteroides sp. CAG:189]|nr:unknown [Bacteroides sp. CAG:189]